MTCLTRYDESVMCCRRRATLFIVTECLGASSKTSSWQFASHLSGYISTKSRCETVAAHKYIYQDNGACLSFHQEQQQHLRASWTSPHIVCICCVTLIALHLFFPIADIDLLLFHNVHRNPGSSAYRQRSICYCSPSHTRLQSPSTRSSCPPPGENDPPPQCQEVPG